MGFQNIKLKFDSSTNTTPTFVAFNQPQVQLKVPGFEISLTYPTERKILVFTGYVKRATADLSKY